MRRLLCLLPIALLTGCAGSADDLFSSADSLVVQFNQPGTQSLLRTVTTANRRVIQNLGRFVKADAADPKCGYTGSLLFFENGQEQGRMQFNANRGPCAHFTWEASGKRTVRRMSNEGADFFEALASGQSFY